ncbi:MAG: ABC transporter ATP-binding protein [Candidatus Omnitrophota bacterium]
MKLNKKELFKFFFSFQKKYLPIAIVTAVLLLVNVLLQLPMPLVTKYLIDKIVPARDFHALNVLCLILLGIILFRQASAYLMQYTISKYKANVRFDLEQALYLHIQDLPVSYFTQKDTGYILSRISEISSIESILADTFLYILRDTITIIVGVILILGLHFKLGMISIALLPFFIFTLKSFHQKIKVINRELREESAQYYGKLEKNLNAMEKIKSWVKEEIEGKRIAQRLSRVIGLGMRAELTGAMAGIASSFVGMIAPFIILWYGMSEIINGTLTLGSFFAINAFTGYLYNPARQLTETGFSISRALAGLERIHEIFNEKKEMEGIEPIEGIDSIEFQNVTFGYEGNDPVLENLNLTIKRGDKIALVGQSGEGKSTVVKMILKFYLPAEGKILISGKDSKDIQIKSLRRRIAYIPQNPFILEDDVEDMFKQQHARELLQKFRLEKSSIEALHHIHQKQFSGGEIQKVELLEALLKEADVLIIDEGTSNIDFNAEKIVLNDLFDKYKEKIIIFIAHRLTSVVDFKRIVVIEKGKITEDGPHDRLMSNKGRYYSFWGEKG